MEFAIFAYILLFSHLRRDRDFSQNVKTTSWVVFGIIGAIYIIFRILF